MRIHSIAADDVISQLSVASKLETDWDFLTSLRDTGRERAEHWLDAHFDCLGVQSTGGLLRIGLVHYNTAEEVDRLLAALREFTRH